MMLLSKLDYMHSQPTFWDTYWWIIPLCILCLILIIVSLKSILRYLHRPIFYHIVGDGASVTKEINRLSVPFLDNPKPRDGYRFTGWYTDSACHTAWDSRNKLTKETTFYAKWEKE